LAQGLLESSWFVASQETPPTAPWPHPCQTNSEFCKIAEFFFSNNPIDLLAGEAAPGKPGPPPLEVSKKEFLSRNHVRRADRRVHDPRGYLTRSSAFEQAQPREAEGIKHPP
jgi:hypothetical protein